jgi:two-component system, NarL family, sensor kinase
MDPIEKELYNSILIVVAVIAAIMVYFIISIIRQQRRYRFITQQKIKAEITTLENERRRIAADLHDEVGPLLSAIKLQINHIDGANTQEKELIEKSSGYIDDISRKMREISNDLLPNVLVRKGLVAAVQDFLSKLKPATKINIDFQHNENLRFETAKEVNMYRIVQEVVHNSIKHSRASQLNIRLQMKENMLRLVTEDDGVGFNFDEIRKTKGGLGLLNLQSRTDVMGGEFSCETGEGKGTKYMFEIPL